MFKIEKKSLKSHKIPKILNIPKNLSLTIDTYKTNKSLHLVKIAIIILQFATRVQLLHVIIEM